MTLLISQKILTIQGLKRIFKFSLVTLRISQEITDNSKISNGFLGFHWRLQRIEEYFQVFTGDFNDVNKIIENSAIETYFQVFTGDLKKSKNSQFKD